MSYDKEDFLTNLNQDENVYLLGFLWADGHVSSRSNEVSIEINSRDFEYIKPLIEKYGYSYFTHRQRYSDGKIFGKGQTCFRISDKKLNSFLRDLDYCQKSLVAPTKILSKIGPDKHYLWWRGFIDGDGNFYRHKTMSKITLWGSINQDWSEFYKLCDTLNLPKPTFKKYERKNGRHKSSCVYFANRKLCLILGDAIFSDRLDIGFARKRETFTKFKEPSVKEFAKKSSYKKGVMFSPYSGKWVCRKFISKKRYHVGIFNDYNEACDAYDRFQLPSETAIH